MSQLPPSNNEDSVVPIDNSSTQSFLSPFKNIINYKSSPEVNETNKFRNLFKKKETIECNECFTQHYDIIKNKYCYNCGHFLHLQTTNYNDNKTDKQKGKILRKQLLSFSINRYNLVTEYQNKCKIMDNIIIEFIESKIKIEEEYIENNKILINKFHNNNPNEFTLIIE
eukprot:459540_1